MLVDVGCGVILILETHGFSYFVGSTDVKVFLFFFSFHVHIVLFPVRNQF